MEIKVQCNTPLIIIINVRMKPKTNANVFQTNESKARQNWQITLLPKSKYDWGTKKDHFLYI
jgi:hypothetical protein